VVASLVWFYGERAAKNLHRARVALVENEGPREAAQGGAVGGFSLQNGLIRGFRVVILAALGEQGAKSGAGIVELGVRFDGSAKGRHGPCGIALVEVGETEIKVGLSAVAVQRDGSGEGRYRAVEPLRFGEVRPERIDRGRGTGLRFELGGTTAIRLPEKETDGHQ
jgi:hypothetical protein